MLQAPGLMSIWLLAYYGYHYAQREINATRESARLAIIAKDAQLNNLTAQLNPHFFFNSLNNIKAQVIDNPQAARRAIDLLSEVLRTSLYNRDTTLITVQQEMALITDYLELEKMRFEERLQTHIEVDETITGAAILPLSIQTLVENAIKHGIARRKAGGRITITVQRNGHGLQATVQNPGTLQTPATGGLGLKNLAERLLLQFNGKASLQLTQPTPETVVATITMPLHMKPYRVVIIDDERLAREEMKRHLLAYPDYEVVGEAADADEAEAMINTLHPHLIFLDIQMPGKIRLRPPGITQPGTRGYFHHRLRPLRCSGI